MRKHMWSVVIASFVIAFGLLVVPNARAGDCPQRFSKWSEPVNLGPTVNVYATFFSAISKDGLSLYYVSNPNPTSLGEFDIFVSQRTSLDSPWGPPVNVGPNVNSPYNESKPFLSADGHRLYFQSDRPGGCGGYDMYVSRRKDTRDDFGWEPAENLGCVVNSSFNDAGPTLYENGWETVLYFASDRPGGPGPSTPNGNGNDIYMSTMQPDGTFGPAVLVSELSTEYFERNPSVRQDGLEIFFNSNRPGPDGEFNELWTSTRAKTSDPWSPPVNLGRIVNVAGYFPCGSPANGAAFSTTGPDLSFDATTLYFTASRVTNLGATIACPGCGIGNNLYVTTRRKLGGCPNPD